MHKKKVATAAMSLVLMGAMAMALSACNTVAGAGQDVSQVGHAVTDSAVAAAPK